MSVNFIISNEFARQFKRLAKKYHSLVDDYSALKKELEENPTQGDDLGCGVHKVRMAITSKNKGKSGGARVLTLTALVNQSDTTDVTFLTIYDKGEIENVTPQHIKWLIEQRPLNE